MLSGFISKLYTKFAFRMPCSPLCGFTNEMHRPHFSCMYCRGRRLYYGKLDRSKYYINPLDGCIVPLEGWSWTLYVDDNRKFPRMKDRLIKLLATIMEMLSA